MTSVSQKIARGDYDPGPLPAHPQRPIPVFSFGSDLPGSSEYRQYAAQLEIYEEKLRHHKELMQEYTRQQEMLVLRFTEDLAEEHGMMDSPKKDVLYQISTELAEGNEYGLHAIADWYARLSILAR